MARKMTDPIKQRDGSYAVVLDKAIVTPEELKRMAEAMEEFNISLIKFTESQRIVIVGIDPERVNEFCEKAGVKIAPATGKGVRSVKFCPGKVLCTMGLQDTIAMAEWLVKFEGMELPDKLKIAVSGCPNSCTEPAVRDIGLMGKKNGFTLYVGGSAGREPRIGRVLAENLSMDEAEKLVEKILKFYKENAKKGQRLGKFIEEIGWDEFEVSILG